MTPKTTIEEPIPGNSLSTFRVQTRFPQGSEPMTRQAPAFENATADRTKTKNHKNTPQGHHDLNVQCTYPQENGEVTPTNLRMQ